jgi:hypothetical protein
VIEDMGICLEIQDMLAMRHTHDMERNDISMRLMINGYEITYQREVNETQKSMMNVGTSDGVRCSFGHRTNGSNMSAKSKRILVIESLSK